jgi:MinD-like ATPase involved in chromosome partitioning or flagellar assembly
VVAGTAARLLARRGHTVLALDSDLMPGLAVSLGLGGAADAPAPLADAAERGEDGRWRLKKGVGPVRAVSRYAAAAPDGVKLLQSGKLPPEGTGAIMGSLQAYYKVIHRLPRAPTFADWAVVGDLPAGPRQSAFDWAPFAETFVILAEPTWQSALTARRVARVVRSRGRSSTIAFVATKVADPADVGRVEELVGEPVVASIPADERVREAERAGAALLDHDPSSPAARAIEGLVDELARHKRPAADSIRDVEVA